jgi:PST family polysaccharide transporter
MSQLVSSAKWLALAQLAKIGLQLVSMTVLARLLEPKYYGIMALANMVIALASLFRDLGTSAAIIQSEQLTERLKTSVFWMSTCAGMALCLLLCLAAPALSMYYREPELLWVVVLVSLTFPLSGATSIHQALLERASSFRSLTFIEVVAQTIGLVLAISAALAGWGVYSLVVQPLAISAVSAALLVRQSRWRPNGPAQWIELKALLHFSGNLTGFNLINFFSRNADVAIIGRMLGSGPLGLYSMAYRLMLFPLQSVTYVSNRALFPELSRHQRDPVRLQALYLDTVRYVAMITFPIMGGLWVARTEFVTFVFGERWLGLDDVIAWLAPVGMIQSVVSTTGTVFMAKARTDVLLRLGILSAVLQVGAFIVGAMHGVVAVAACYLLANAVNFVPAMYVTLRQVDSGFASLLARLAPPAVGCAAMVAGVMALRHALLPFAWPAAGLLIAMATTGAAIYFGCLFLFFRDSWSALVKPLLARRRTSA